MRISPAVPSIAYPDQSLRRSALPLASGALPPRSDGGHTYKEQDITPVPHNNFALSLSSYRTLIPSHHAEFLFSIELERVQVTELLSTTASVELRIR